MNEAKRLNTITFNDKKYYVDTRLKEFRTVEPPLQVIPFNSADGQGILEYIYNLIGTYY